MFSLLLKELISMFFFSISAAPVVPCSGPRSIKVKSMQRSGTEAFRTQIQPSGPKQEITNITNSQSTKRTYGQPSEQLFIQKVATQQPN